MSGALMAGIITKAEHTAVLRKRLGADAQVALFSDADSLHIVDAVLAHPPKILALDATFATTARGAALIAQVKAAPSLAGIELRVLLDDENQVPLIVDHALTSPMTALLQTSRPLERVGTRRAVRYPMERRTVVVNGEHGQLVDLSVSGAQVLAMIRLQPGQAIRVTLVDGPNEIRCAGTIAWSIASPVGPAIKYRAGIEFSGADTEALAAYCERFGTHPDLTFSGE
jgi:hypothetical protein